jgi:uncharacterized protein YerC
MPHISRQFLEKKREKELVRVLIENLTKKGNPKSRSSLCWELFTGVERLMLAKRLAIICLLGDGVPFEQISKELKVSSSTVARLWARMQQGKFKRTIQAVKKNKIDEFVGSIFSLLLTGPRGRHEPRWKFLEDIQ